MEHLKHYMDYRIGGAISAATGLLASIGWRGTLADFTLVCGAAIGLISLISGVSNLYDRFTRKRNKPDA